MLEKTLETPLNSKEIKSVNPKGNQPWILIGRTDAEVPVFWAPKAKSQLIGKDFDAGKDWGQEKGITQDEMVEWHHWLNGHEFEQTLGDSKRQGSLACGSHGIAKSGTLLSDCTTTTKCCAEVQKMPTLRNIAIKFTVGHEWERVGQKNHCLPWLILRGYLIFWKTLTISWW